MEGSYLLLHIIRLYSLLVVYIARNLFIGFKIIIQLKYQIMYYFLKWTMFFSQSIVSKRGSMVSFNLNRAQHKNCRLRKITKINEPNVLSKRTKKFFTM